MSVDVSVAALSLNITVRGNYESMVILLYDRVRREYMCMTFLNVFAQFFVF